MSFRRTNRALLAMLTAALLLPLAAAAAPHVRIGVLTNLSGTYAAYAGEGSVDAARIAIDDAGMKGEVDLISADHQGNPDLGLAIARDWFEHKTDAIFDVPNSSVALAVNALAGEVHRLVFFSTPFTDRITNEDCNGYGLAWTWDVYSVAHIATMAQIKQGMKSWFLIAQDYPGGSAMESVIRQTLEDNGATLAGAARHALGETEYAPYFEEAKNSGAQFIAFTAGGPDLSSAIGQVRVPDAIGPDQRVGMMYTTITEVHGAGLNLLQGLEFATAFYWDRDERSRRFAERFFAVHKAMPTMFQAGVYSAVLNYLRAVKATGVTKAETVRDWLRHQPIEDAFARGGQLQADGRMAHDMLLARIKTPEESHGPWDYYRIMGVVRADQAFRSAADTRCPLR